MRLSAAGLLASLVVLGGCAALAGPDEYRSARELPPLALPAGAETRPIRPLYAIPPGPVPQSWPKKFEVPRPRPLDPAAQPALAPEAADAAVGRPVLGQDGNGYPIATVAGDFNAIWDRLEEALRGAAVRVEDRDQRVSMYYLRLDDETGKGVAYQLRLGRAQSAWTLTLQKDDDTLAPRATSEALFAAIVRHWPGEGPRPAGPRP